MTFIINTKMNVSLLIGLKKYETKTPLRRMATEDDFRGVIMYLASDLSNYVTGQNIAVDGGWGIW